MLLIFIWVFNLQAQIQHVQVIGAKLLQAQVMEVHPRLGQVWPARDTRTGHLLSRHEELLSRRGELRMMWYNVENLFYPDNDSLSGDDDFTPEGIRHWTYGRYNAKLTQLAKVIIASGNWEPPDLVGMCEVENARVLEELTRHPLLAPYNYGYLLVEGNDRRGMDVACLYRKKRVDLVERTAFPPVPGAGFEKTRDVLHVCFTWGKSDTLDLFLVHLISKYRGAGVTATYRKQQVEDLIGRVDSVSGLRPYSLKLLCGDFNEVYEGYSMEPLRLRSKGELPIRRIAIETEGGGGSYKYHGSWSLIDQIFMCGPLERYRIRGSVLWLKHLVMKDETYGGWKPERTYEGYHYQGGCSDHLPLVLDISPDPFSIHSAQPAPAFSLLPPFFHKPD